MLRKSNRQYLENQQTVLSSSDSPCQTNLKIPEIHARQFWFFFAFYSPLVLKADDWHLRKPYKFVNCQLTRSDGKPGEHDGSGGEELLDEDGLETPWLGGALAALHSSLMEDVWPASMAAFSCFSESTLAPDTRRTNLESEVSISGEKGALSRGLFLRVKIRYTFLQETKPNVFKTILWPFHHVLIYIFT